MSMLNQDLRLYTPIVDVDDGQLAPLHLSPAPEVGAERGPSCLAEFSRETELENKSDRVHSGKDAHLLVDNRLPYGSDNALPGGL